MSTTNLPYSHNKGLNDRVRIVMSDWYALMAKAKTLGLTINLAPDTAPLELYFNDDYPDMILVDKYYSARKNEIKEEN